MPMKTAKHSRPSSVRAGADVTDEIAVHVRAANLADLDALDSLPSLKPSPSFVRALSQLLQSNSASTERAWTLVGPYGAELLWRSWLNARTKIGDGFSDGRLSRASRCARFGART